MPLAFDREPSDPAYLRPHTLPFLRSLHARDKPSAARTLTDNLTSRCSEGQELHFIARLGARLPSSGLRDFVRAGACLLLSEEALDNARSGAYLPPSEALLVHVRSKVLSPAPLPEEK